MEEENEQLDYDEDELIAARKKAAELQKAIELDGQNLTKTMAGSIADGNSSVPVPSVSIESSTMASAADQQIQPVDSNPVKVTSTTTESIATTSTTSAAAGASGIQQPVVRYHVNPNFNRNKIFQHSNSNMQPKPSAPYGLVAAGQTSHYYNKHLTMSGTNHSHPPPNHQLHHLHSGQQHIYANGTFPAHQSQQPQLQYNVSTQIPPSSHPPPAPPFTGLPTGNNIYINRSAITDNKNWDLMVDEFVRRNNSARQRRNYSRGRSSTSSSSSSSYSNSRSSSTTSKNSAKSHEKNDRYQGNSKKRDLQQQKKPHQRERGNPSERKKISSQTIECAKAIGLDEGYLKKIEEQNRLREEIMRRKTQHRKETAKERTQRQQAKGPTESKAEEAAPPNKRPKVQGPEVAAESKSKGTKSTARPPANNNSSTASQDATAASKLRPYLAVTVANLKEVRGAQKKVELLATSIGPIKKSWLESANICNVIFEKHEHAKQFILQHHGKILDKARIDVTLKKVFLNISTIANN